MAGKDNWKRIARRMLFTAVATAMMAGKASQPYYDRVHAPPRQAQALITTAATEQGLEPSYCDAMPDQPMANYFDRSGVLSYDLYLPEHDSNGLRDSNHRPPVMIMLSGILGSKNSVSVTWPVKHVLDAGMAVACIDYSEHDIQTNEPIAGEITPERALARVHTMLKYLKDRYGDEIDMDRIIGCGTSYGAQILLQYAAENNLPPSQRMLFEQALPLKGLVLQGPTVDTKSFFKDKMAEHIGPIPTWPLKEKIWAMLGSVEADLGPDKFDLHHDNYDYALGHSNAELAPYITIPTDIAWGEKDPLTPQDKMRQFYNAMPRNVPKAMKIYPGAGHYFEHLDLIPGPLPTGQDSLNYTLKHAGEVTEIGAVTEVGTSFAINALKQ